ncbi:MAG: hypothetical protein RLZZ535_3083 [Cyanobacteriota bacterium]|jgi:hypothetical protein
MSENARLSKIEEQIQQLRARASQIKAVEKGKLRKEETRDKILLGVILQGMIADGRISAKLFEESLEKYITTDKDRDRCDAYYEKHSTWKAKE